MPATTKNQPFKPGPFITSQVSSEVLAAVISTLVSERGRRPLRPAEEALCDDACREMRERILETMEKRPNVSANVITPTPAAEPPPPETGPAIPANWFRVKAGSTPLMTDKIHDGKKYRYLTNNDVQMGPVKADDFIIRERVGGPTS